MTYLIDHHRAVADPFDGGDDAPHLGSMMNMTEGWAWPWGEGGIALLRRELYPDLLEWEYCGLAIGADTQIKNYPGFGHQADQAYQYTAVTFLGNGFISPVAEPVRLDFDATGDLIQPLLPMFPVNVTADPIAGGKYRVTIEYDPYGQGAFPKDFQVFEGADPGSVDYNTPLVDSVTALDYVPYVGGRIASFTTAAYGQGSVHVFGVRARNSGGVAERNTYTTTSKIARSVTPTPAGVPIRARVEPIGQRAG